MFDDDFFAKTSEALNGFFDSIEKSIKGLQKEVDSAKDKMKESAEKAKAENENVFKGDDVKEEPAKAEAKAEDKTEAKNETADEGKKDGEAAAKKPFEDWFNKAKDAVSGIKIGGAPKVTGIPYFRADTADTVNIFCELPGCDRINVKLSYNTESTFDTDKELIKLTYQGKEDDIIRKIDVGNVSLPLSSTLIPGSNALFGIMTELQYGKLKYRR